LVVVGLAIVDIGGEVVIVVVVAAIALAVPVRVHLVQVVMEGAVVEAQTQPVTCNPLGSKEYAQNLVSRVGCTGPG
jgi:hypothetical protein